LPDRYKQVSNIGDNIIRMRGERDFLKVRQIAIARTINRLHKRLNKTEDEEERRAIRDMIRSSLFISSELRDYVNNFNGELERFKKGLISLKSISKQPEAFQVMANYIYEDTDYTIKNLLQARHYYDRMVSVLYNSIREDSTGTQTTDDEY